MNYKIKIAVVAALTFCAVPAHAVGASGDEYHKLESSLICAALSNEAGLNKAMTPEKSVKAFNNALAVYRDVWPKMQLPSYNPTPDEFITDFASSYGSIGVAGAIYAIEDALKAKGIADYGDDHTSEAVKQWNLRNCDSAIGW